MKQTDLKPCALCGEGLMHKGLPLFFRLRIERMAVDMAAVKRQHGLETMLGSPLLAQIMGPNADLASVVDGPHDVLVCESCVVNRMTALYAISEAENDRKETVQ